VFRRHPILSALTLVYLGVVGWITLGPQPLDANGSAILLRIVAELQQHDLTGWVTYSRIEFLANVAMFVPIGVFFLLLMGRKWWIPAIFAGIGVTMAIEFVQLYLPGRVSDPRDLVSNTVGAAVGVIAALIVTTPAAIRDRRATRRRPAVSR
jgi:glycopeptide antibiotics resistance protein